MLMVRQAENDDGGAVRARERAREWDATAPTRLPRISLSLWSQRERGTANECTLAHTHILGAPSLSRFATCCGL